MQQSQANHNIPFPLRKAYDVLIVALDEAIQQDQSNGHFDNPDEIARAVERFVDEFFRVPSAAEELARRCSLVASLCGQDTEYRKRMNAAFTRLRSERRKPHAKRRKPLGPKISGAKIAHRRLRPKTNLEFLADLEIVISAIKRATLENVIPLVAQSAFRSWLDECNRIALEADRQEVDGCLYLWRVSQSWNPHATGADRVASVILKTQFGGVLLLPMKAAADSLMAWAASVATSDPELAGNADLRDEDSAGRDADEIRAQQEALDALIRGGFPNAVAVPANLPAHERINAIWNDILDRTDNADVWDRTLDDWVVEFRRLGHKVSKKTLQKTVELEDGAWSRIKKHRQGRKNERLVSKETAESFHRRGNS